MEIQKKSIYQNILSIIVTITCFMLFILGAINLVQELPNNISNQTILLFILAFGCMLVNKD